MGRLALALAFGAMIMAALPAPGLYLALGLGIGAMGMGWTGYGRRQDPGFTRLTAAAAITLGGLGVLLGTLRVVLALAAIDHIDQMLG